MDPNISVSSSSTISFPTSPLSSSQDSVSDVIRYIENLVPERSASTTGGLRVNLLYNSTKFKNRNKNEEREKVQRDISHELSDWQPKLRKNLFDESTSTESLVEVQSKEVKISWTSNGDVSTFRRSPDYDICMKTKITRTSCRRRAGTVVSSVLTISTNLWEYDLIGISYRYHEDHIATKGMYSLSHFFLVHKFFVFLKYQKFRIQRLQWKKKWEILQKISACQLSEVRNKKKVIDEVKNKSSFCVIDGSLSSQEFEDGASISKVQRLSRIPRWHWPRWFRIIRCIYWTKIIRITDESRKSHGHYIKTSGIRPTSSWYSIHLSQIKMEDSSMLLKIPKSDCTGSWILLSKHKWSQSWSSMEDLTDYEDAIKFIDKKQNINPTWKILMKDVDLGKSISFLDHVYLDCTRRGCLISKDIVDNSKSMFESKISVGTIKIFQKQESQGNQTLILSLHDSILWKSTQRSTWKDSISWGGKKKTQRNNYTKSHDHQFRWRNRIGWRIVNSLSHKMIWNVYSSRDLYW